MAITSSAKKANRVSARRRLVNLRRRRALHDASAAFVKALSSKDPTGASRLLPAAYQAIDKATKSGVIKANTAARKKARLAAALGKVA